MAQTEFTGKNATVSYDGKTFEGLLNGTVKQDGKGPTEQLPATVNGDAGYTTIPDPLGPKGAPKASVKITLQDSLNAYADDKQSKVAFNTPATLIVDMAAGTANANTYTHTAMELTQRVTKIVNKGLAECELTFEANVLGAWTSPT